MSQYRTTGRHGKTPDFTKYPPFGLWTVEAFLGYHQGNAYWATRCACGTVSAVSGYSLKQGASTSCGCEKAEFSRKLHTTHGMSYTREMTIWNAMVQRCTNPKNKEYARYGGRGITVCDAWQTFEGFYADMGDRPAPGMSIDRYPDMDGNYEPGNVRWATAAEQVRNRRVTRWVTHNGLTLCITDWARRLGMHPSAVSQRLRNGASLEEALNNFVPFTNKRKRKS